MKLMKPYLEASEFINWDDSSVNKKATLLASGAASEIEVARNCFEFVRDHIKHSGDHQLNPITCKASDVLQHKTGYCYAKSHLLAALLRANKIPTGLCYQRQSLNDEGSEFCLHGLNAIHLTEFGWYRVDPRGDKLGITTAFCPPIEKLAFGLSLDGEFDLNEIYSSPRSDVVNVLTSCTTYVDVNENLPDISIIKTKQNY